MVRLSGHLPPGTAVPPAPPEKEWVTETASLPPSPTSTGTSTRTAAAWQEPAPRVVDLVSCADQRCPAVSTRHAVDRPVSADSDNLVLLIFGLSHAMKGAQ